jgi:hypothetical protein
MADRDEFPRKAKQALALRAAYLCSFRGCQRPTSGPSHESPNAVSMTGKAAHIHAAAPGGRRYLASMTPKERADISNGIWLCAFHADLVDKDEVTYTADLLRAMKREHEANCDQRHRDATRAGQSIHDLIAIGPDIVFCGDFLGVDQSEWSFHLQDYVEGDLHALLTFIEPLRTGQLPGRWTRLEWPTVHDQRTDRRVHCPLSGIAERASHPGRRPSDRFGSVGKA